MQQALETLELQFHLPAEAVGLQDLVETDRSLAVGQDDHVLCQDERLRARMMAFAPTIADSSLNRLLGRLGALADGDQPDWAVVLRSAEDHLTLGGLGLG